MLKLSCEENLVVFVKLTPFESAFNLLAQVRMSQNDIGPGFDSSDLSIN